MLAIQKLEYSYKKNIALKDIDLQWSTPAIVGLLGHNGSGKSTLLKILGASLACQSGNITIFGQNALDKTRFIRRSLRHKIGVLFQSTSSDKALSARENLLFFSRLMGLSKVASMAAVEQTLKLANLEKRACEALKSYSHGMRRRLEIYRAFMHEPKILVLDEPTEGLDFAESERFWAFLKNYVEVQQALVLIATHRGGELEHCDEVVMMNEGLIIAQHSPKELLASLEYLHVEVELRAQAEDSWLKLGFFKESSNPAKLQAQMRHSDLLALLRSPKIHSPLVKSVRWQQPQLPDAYEMRTKGARL